MTLVRLRVLGRWLVRASIFAFLTVVAAAVTVLIVLPRATHGTALTVLTASMTPDIPVGSVVIDRPVDPATLHVGDIATYQETAGKAVYITHRIAAIDTATNPVTFTFKGDANRGPDLNPVPATAIRGQVWFHVPYLGAIRDSLRAGGDRATLLGLLIVGLGLYAIFQLITGLRGQRRNRGRHAATTQTLALELADDAFGDVGPHFVAELLGATCTGQREGGVTLTFTHNPERFPMIRQLLEPYGAQETVRPDADGVGGRERVGRHSLEWEERFDFQETSGG